MVWLSNIYLSYPLKKFIEQGAEFLIINQRAPKMKDWNLVEEYLDKPLADTNDVFIYKLELN